MQGHRTQCWRVEYLFYCSFTADEIQSPTELINPLRVQELSMQQVAYNRECRKRSTMMGNKIMDTNLSCKSLSLYSIWQVNERKT